MHQGHIAEMNTGEGKTLTATMPVYLNALSGEGAILVTTNEYLAIRDAEEMGQVYEFLGLTIGVPCVEGSNEMEPAEKRAIYQSDIVYTTNSSLGFDYLIDNLASNQDGKYMRPFNYAIVDEVDSVLLDSAQTPLIISGAPRVQSNYYGMMDTLMTTLVEGEDYIFKEEKGEVWLTTKGLRLLKITLVSVTSTMRKTAPLPVTCSFHFVPTCSIKRIRTTSFVMARRDLKWYFLINRQVVSWN